MKHEYAHLLAVAARSYGGASPSDFYTLLGGSSASAADRPVLRALCDELSTSSGYSSSLPLFSGVPLHCSPLDAAHAAAFGPGLSAAELLSGGLDDAAKLPGRLALRLASHNAALFSDALTSFCVAHAPDLLSHSVVSVDGSSRLWVEAQSPAEFLLPPAFASLDSALEHVVLAVSGSIVSSTCAALRLRRLPGTDVLTQAARCLDVNFLARYFRRVVWRGVESMRLSAKHVGRRASSQYVSSNGYAAWHARARAQREWMDSVYVMDRSGKAKPRRLSDVAPSNEARRARLLTVLAGIESLAVESGLSAAMITLTLPPEYHANPAMGSDSYGGSGFTPDAGARVLSERWAAFLRDLDNAGVRISGLRVVEPQQDGTPHLHVLVYYVLSDEPVIFARLAAAYDVSAFAVRSLRVHPRGKSVTRKGVAYDAVRTYYDADLAVELAGTGGRAAKAIEFSRINRAVSSAASYVAKYVMKAMDYDDLGDLPVASPATAAAAHASGWGYRRYAFFGVRSSLSVWDALRRVKSLPDDADPRLLEARAFAVDGDYASFLKLFGGLDAKRPGVLSSRPIYELRLNRYGEAVRDFCGVEVYAGSDLLAAARFRDPGRFYLAQFDADPDDYEEECPF